MKAMSIEDERRRQLENAGSMDLNHCARNSSKQWQAILAEPRGIVDTKEYRNSSKTNSRRIPKLLRMESTPGNAETCGGFGGAGWIERLHEIANRKIVPYVKPPEEIIQDVVVLRHFHAACGIAAGCWSKATWGGDENRRKSRAPGSLGGTDVFAQASVLTPLRSDRSADGDARGTHQQLGAFVTAIGNARLQLAQRPAAGSHGDSDLADSRCTDTRTAGILEAKWHQYEPCGRDKSAKRAAGVWAAVNTVYRFDRRT